mgnify:CR=1 FL=1
MRDEDKSKAQLIKELTEVHRRHSENKFRSVFEDSGIGMVLGDTQGRLIQVNKAMCDMLGYSQEEMLSMKISDISYTGEPDQNSEYMQQLWRGETGSQIFEKRYLHNK